MIRISEVEASRGLYAVQRRNLYPFLSKEEMEGWMADEGPLRVRWFVAREDRKKIGVAAWEVYDLHQYEEPNGPRIAILDLYTMDVEAKFRGKGVGRRLFAESLKATVESLREAGFVAGALQIETVTAREFYEKVLVGYSFKLETREILPGRPVYVFWVPLLGQ